METRVGTELAGYRIESVIGRGGMGVVYLAEHLQLRRKVALKVLAPQLVGDGRFRERFIRESELAASLDHPNIVDIYDAGQGDGALYIAMRLVEGTDLKSLIAAEGPLQPGRAVSIVVQVAGALDAAHGRGLVHRDVKPANVLVGREDHVYLTDFGLTKRPESASGITRTGQFLGSVEYAAPEQFEGKPLDARTDVYSLGCVAFECLTGNAPFARETEAATMYAHLREAPPSVHASRPQVPESVDRALAAAMAKSPAHRPASAGSFARMLQAAMESGHLAPAAEERRARRRRTAMVASALGMILAVAVTAGILVRSDGPARPARGGEAATDDPLLRIDPTTNRVASSLALPTLGRSVAAGAGFVWIGSNDTVSKLNPSTGTRVASIAGLSGTCNYGPACSVTSITVAEGTVWAAVPITTTTGGGAVVEIDPRTNAMVRRVDVPTATNLVYLDGSLWVTDPARGQVFRIDPADGEIVATIPAESSARPSSISAGDGAVWVVDGANGRVARIDARTNRVTREIPVEDAAGVAIGEGGVWVTSSTAGTVTEYSPDGDTLVGSVDIGTSADAVATSPGAVWVTSLRDGKVVRIDPSTREIEAVIPAPSNPVAVTVGEGAVWVLQAPGFSFSRG